MARPRRRTPAPRVVTPGESFSHLAKPPSDAVVLFDGTDLANWEGGKTGKPGWKVENGYMEVVGGSGSIQTKGSSPISSCILNSPRPPK